jgi:6-oxo-cyclohex-1-ene-carbonyl-CoA hydrolase
MGFELKNHDLVEGHQFGAVRYQLKACRTPDGSLAEGLYSAWITLDNPSQHNSYTTSMVKDVILAFRKASNDRSVAAVVFTGAGDRAFCTGGNTKEYAEYYAGRPLEYGQYMRLFNDMVSSILLCDQPVINRVNGMRIGGGQEIGMACDFSIAADHATFGQAGPKHGSAPDGGATDFLPLFVGVERAMKSCTLCERWTAQQAYHYGLISEVVPLDALDGAVERMVTSLLMTMPGCLSKTVASVRKHKLEHWDRNRETNRAWLALNMMSEGLAGFRAFNEGPKERREVDFVRLRQLLAAGQTWGPELLEAILPRKK